MNIDDAVKLLIDEFGLPLETREARQASRLSGSQLASATLFLAGEYYGVLTLETGSRDDLQSAVYSGQHPVLATHRGSIVLSLAAVADELYRVDKHRVDFLDVGPRTGENPDIIPYIVGTMRSIASLDAQRHALMQRGLP